MRRDAPGQEWGMRLSLPGPAAVIGGAAAAAEAIETAIGLVPRAAAALDRVEALLDRLDGVVDRADAAITAGAGAAERTESVLATAEIVTRDAGRQVEGASGVMHRVDILLQQWEPPLRSLLPSVRRFSEALSPGEVDAAIGMVDRLPQILEHLEDDVLPMLQQLDRVGPDLHAILEIVEDLRKVVTGLPGVGLLRRNSDDPPPAVEQAVNH
jgi:ABC-type transporter Mla subunit MlaD